MNDGKINEMKVVARILITEMFNVFVGIYLDI